MLIGTLYPHPSYDFQRTISAARFHTVLDVARGSEYWRALRVDDKSALIQVTQKSGTLEVNLMHATGDIDTALLLAKISYLMGIDTNMTPFYDRARADRILWSIVEPLYGLNHLRAETLYEALVTTIIEQQIALSLAQRGERWLVQWADNWVEYKGEHFYTFPRPDQIAAAISDDLKPLKITINPTQGQPHFTS